MPNYRSHEELMKPISKVSVVFGNIFILAIILFIMAILFLIPCERRQNISMTVIAKEEISFLKIKNDMLNTICIDGYMSFEYKGKTYTNIEIKNIYNNHTQNTSIVFIKLNNYKEFSDSEYVDVKVNSQLIKPHGVMFYLK